jgi:hypothetical protein
MKLWRFWSTHDDKILRWISWCSLVSVPMSLVIRGAQIKRRTSFQRKQTFRQSPDASVPGSTSETVSTQHVYRQFFGLDEAGGSVIANRYRGGSRVAGWLAEMTHAATVSLDLIFHSNIDQTKEQVHCECSFGLPSQLLNYNRFL